MKRLLLPDCAGGQYGPASPRRAEAPPHYLTALVNRADGPEDRSLGERCMSGQLPDFGGAAGFFLQIVQSPGTVSIFYDTGQGQAWQRIIPVTDRPHLPSHVRQWWGDSRGRWEGKTLVVDVTNFSPKTDFQGSRENLHLVERWTRLDADTIKYVVMMDDPTTWMSPWTVALELSRQSNEANRIYKEPRCHEGNYGLPALLRGARAEELAFAERRGPDPATLCNADCGSAFIEENRDPLRWGEDGTLACRPSKAGDAIKARPGCRGLRERNRVPAACRVGGRSCGGNARVHGSRQPGIAKGYRPEDPSQ